ncbi:MULTISPECIES: ROK family protein [Paraburkholderia]|uniref:ROK family protein n=1 Tax=Paraburkholderia TaxID=1822464 RepID=UPI00224D0EF9|nr:MULTISPECIES: ROK family protein [Paraburkholderia]MCX4160125.1 ROK family protein [Paraburkholderia megapolitana]MDN7155624.1 ROK family protein [Paraburkholderia sp. CHISQ3]MDQ6492668.1 ROK family protein [Paraburkholderia megapolitana]
MSKVNSVAERPALENSGEILSLIATGAATSRPALLDASGLSRVTVTLRLNALIDSGVVREAAQTIPSGGRPTRVLRINERAGFLLVANIGETYIHLAAMDLEPAVIAQSTVPFRASDGPASTLEQIAREFDKLAKKVRASHGMLFGISLSLPTPVDFKRGRIVGPSVLHLWDEFDIIGWLRERFDAPIYVENDVNLMTIYEHRQNFPHVEDMFFIKAGTGIGSGIVTGGKIFRGAQGAAGDIGHIQFNSDDAPLCRCGKLGCVEARAGGWAIARHLSSQGFKAENARDVISLVETQQPEALMLLRGAGRVIGEVAADVVSILNPSLIVVGGTLARGGEVLLSGIRELVYQRCLPLATRELQIVLADPPKDSVLFGAAFLALEDVFSHMNVGGLIERLGAYHAQGR